MEITKKKKKRVWVNRFFILFLLSRLFLLCIVESFGATHATHFINFKCDLYYFRAVRKVWRTSTRWIRACWCHERTLGTAAPSRIQRCNWPAGRRTDCRCPRWRHLLSSLVPSPPLPPSYRCRAPHPSARSLPLRARRARLTRPWGAGGYPIFIK